jgi:hypothetical protein
MELWQIILLVIVVAAVVAGGAYVLNQRRRTQELTARFGPEYQHAVEESGDRRMAEHELEERRQRVEHMQIRTLDPAEQRRFAASWRLVQAQFVDDPSGAIAQADTLVQELLDARGYEVGEGFDRVAADASVNHGQVVSEYRKAHAISERHAADGVETEELRKAMVHYRALFDDLLETPQAQTTGARA